MAEVYAYKETGRRPATYLAALVFALVLVGMLFQMVPPAVFLPVITGGAMLLYLLVKNPVSGLVLLPDRLILSAWTEPHPVAVADIERIEIIDWSDSTDMRVLLKSGGVIQVFSGDIPPRRSFADALSRVGIPLDVH